MLNHIQADTLRRSLYASGRAEWSLVLDDATVGRLCARLEQDEETNALVIRLEVRLPRHLGSGQTRRVPWAVTEAQFRSTVGMLYGYEVAKAEQARERLFGEE